MTRDLDGRFAPPPPRERTCPLVWAMRDRGSERVARGNRTRRLNEMRRCREAMTNATDYPARKQNLKSQDCITAKPAGIEL